ncbi:MAG TPA: hypothetical protein VGV68_10485 [Terriglobia bacterium]|nr:hypothetical protein [Terriglobia bacterium]
MKKSEEARISEACLKKCMNVARKNWNEWRDVFEHRGYLASNPLLADKDRFVRFLSEYSVGRTIWKGKREKLRMALTDHSTLRKAIQDDTGHALDNLERDLRPRFGSKKGKGRLVSALSKVAAFIKPERFVAWDRFARKGFNIELGRSDLSPFNNYSDYLAAFDSIWDSEVGRQIRNYVEKNDTHDQREHEPAFLRRVLDVYLMKRGGRWSGKGRRK